MSLNLGFDSPSGRHRSRVRPQVVPAAAATPAPLLLWHPDVAMRLAAGAEPAPGGPAPVLSLSIDEWRRDDFDLLGFDDLVWRHLARWGRCAVHFLPSRISGTTQRRTAAQVAIRYQRFTGIAPLNDRHLASLFVAHARLHDRSKPLVAADHDHALDTWAWVMRLHPAAPLPLQLAALFHDIERLHSESEHRIEQYAADYATFKAAHAVAGAAIVYDVLRGLGVADVVADRTRCLVARHEFGGEANAEAVVLTDADALSFFSLNASGFLRYYGRGHTARKVAYTLARLSGYGRRQLARIKLARDVRVLMRAAG